MAAASGVNGTWCSGGSVWCTGNCVDAGDGVDQVSVEVPNRTRSCMGNTTHPQSSTHGQQARPPPQLTSRSCSCVFAAPPSSWLTRAPTALEGPAPSEPEHMSLPVTSVRSAILSRRAAAAAGGRGVCCRLACWVRSPSAARAYLGVMCA